MEKQVRCKKCGRVLKSPASIARGIGSTCAGIGIKSGKTFQSSVRHASTQTYATVGTNKTHGASPDGDLSNKPANKRDERRKLFEARRPFQCGVLTRTRTPLIYVPAGESEWKEKHSGRVIPNDKLQAYLKRFSLI